VHPSPLFTVDERNRPPQTAHATPNKMPKISLHILCKCPHVSRPGPPRVGTWIRIRAPAIVCRSHE